MAETLTVGKNYKVVLQDNKAESILCAKAANEGLKSIRDSKKYTVSCNNISISSFAKKYSRS